MKKLHPFYVIGTFGMIILSVLHIAMAFSIKSASVHTTFFTLYPVFLSFLALGFGLTLKKQRT